MLIVANWKAYVADLKKAKKLLEVSKRLTRSVRCTIVLAPPAPLLGVLAVGNKSKIAFAAQDVSVVTGGAKTGEITAGALAASGARYVIVGHSERRAAGDTDSIIIEKISRSFAQGLTSILCVGEPSRDTEGKYLSYVREQLTVIYKALSPKERAKIVIAYEPLWAIGKTADAAIGHNDLAEMTLYIRKVLAELTGKTASRALILYGGSVESSNVRALAAGSDIDGFLIGHASADEFFFSDLVKQLRTK
jgi:triosephosphate isomerase